MRVSVSGGDKDCGKKASTWGGGSSTDKQNKKSTNMSAICLSLRSRSLFLASCWTLD